MMNKLAIFAITYFFCEGVFTYDCNPQADCLVAGMGALVPDPSDCEKYYVCIASGSDVVPSTESLSCPPNSYFDQTTGSCNLETTSGICQNVCRDKGVCATDCPEDFTSVILVADETDCGIYYICDGVSNYTGRCPPNTPNFNGVTCVTDQSQCCQCTPYCSSLFLQIQDPCDCSAYYYCSAKGQPHDINRIHCQDGYYFDETSNHCVAGSCTSVCTNCPFSQETSPFPTTTTITTTSTQPTTPDNNCLSTYNCPTDGNFFRCNYCDPSYFHCKGGNATIEYCSDDTVFNPNIQYPFCIPPEMCPY